MAACLDRLTADMKAALREGRKDRLRVVRLLIHALRQEQLERQRDDLDEKQELAVLQKETKTRRDSIAQAQQQGRQDIAEGEQTELAIVEGYLPPMMEPAELVAELAREIGYGGAKDRGRFMKEWMARYKVRTDGRAVQAELGKLG